MLERRDEGELDALTLLVASLGGSKAVREAERLIRVGVHPHRLEEWLRGAIVGIRRGAVVDRQHALGPPLDRLQAGVGGDLVEPGPQRAAALEPGQPPPGTQQRLLERVLGIRDRAEHSVAVGVKLSVVGTYEPAEGILVTLPGGLEQLALIGGQPCGSGLHPWFTLPFGCQKAISPPSGVATTLRQPAGPSRGSSNTDAPSRHVRSVNWSTWSISTYGSHSGRSVPHSTMPPPKPFPSSSAR